MAPASKPAVSYLDCHIEKLLGTGAKKERRARSLGALGRGSGCRDRTRFILGYGPSEMTITSHPQSCLPDISRISPLPSRHRVEVSSLSTWSRGESNPGVGTFQDRALHACLPISNLGSGLPDSGDPGPSSLFLLAASPGKRDSAASPSGLCIPRRNAWKTLSGTMGVTGQSEVPGLTPGRRQAAISIGAGNWRDCVFAVAFVDRRLYRPTVILCVLPAPSSPRSKPLRPRKRRSVPERHARRR